MDKEQLVKKIKRQSCKMGDEIFIFSYSKKCNQDQQICYVMNGDYIRMYDDEVDMFLGNCITNIDVQDSSNDLFDYHEDFLSALLYSLENNVADIEITMRNKK